MDQVQDKVIGGLGDALDNAASDAVEKAKSAAKTAAGTAAGVAMSSVPGLAGVMQTAQTAMDTINTACLKVLDDMFADVAWDVSSDINVMKQMMARDGLTEPQAHRTLQQAAMNRGMRMADCAAQIIKTSRETEE